MKYPLLSIGGNPPPGFSVIPSLSERDVRSGPFALHCASVGEAEDRIRQAGGNTAGIVVTDTDAFVWEPLEIPLFHLGVPPLLRPLLPVLLPSLLGLLDAIRAGIDETRTLSLELAGAVEDRRRLSEDFGRSRESLLEEIAERKKAEEDQKIFASLVENSNDLIGIASFDGTLTYMNQAGRILLGLEAEGDVRGINLREFVFPKHQPMLEFLYSEILRTGSWKGETKFRHFRTGASVYFDTLAFVIRDPKTGQGVAFAKISRDMGERRAIERERIQIQKLESVGILAGGIAHDFNNLLSAIAGYVSLARACVPVEGKVGEHLSKAEQATFRAKDLTHQLLTFSRGGTPVIKPTSVREMIRESSNWALQGSNVQCDIAVPPDLWLVDADEGQINQVMNNLLINACQAMPGGGTIQISARNVTFGTNERPPLEGGRYVKVSVQDHGIGIPGEHLPKIFDPYFSTKQHGSGLGLATSYAILQKHRGIITVESKLGVGTTFHLFLPVSRGNRIEQIPVEAMPLKGEGKILVMDDDKVIRDVVSSMLRKLGFSTSTAADGEEAITLYGTGLESGEPFDAVIMDLTVPGGLGGKEAITKLLQVDPKAKVIVSSGYSNDDIMSNYKAYGFSAAVPKPFNLTQLGEVIGRLLFHPH